MSAKFLKGLDEIMAFPGAGRPFSIMVRKVSPSLFMSVANPMKISSARFVAAREGAAPARQNDLVDGRGAFKWGKPRKSALAPCRC